MHFTDGTFLSTWNFYELAPFSDMIWQKNLLTRRSSYKNLQKLIQPPNYIPIKHFLENENFNVLIKLPFQYDIDVPSPQAKKLWFRFLCQKIVVKIFLHGQHCFQLWPNCRLFYQTCSPTRLTVIWDEDYDFPHHYYHHHHHHHHHRPSKPASSSSNYILSNDQHVLLNEDDHHIIFIIPWSS